MENKSPLTVVKIGGNIIDDAAALENFLSDFASLTGPKLLVHGGGKLATRTAESLGIVPVFHNGKRITNAPMLEVAVMTYAGWINKFITGKLQALQTNAMGFTGADGNLITSEKRKDTTIDFGFAGDIKAVNTTLLKLLIAQGIVPVFSAITHDGNGQLLNTNADTIASALAIALSKTFDVELLYCFEKKGVLSDIENENSVLPKITFDSYKKLKHKGVIHSGMLPKLDNCFEALSQGVSQIGIGGPEMLQKDNSIFTHITS
ncbi:acetylglutamate kinase [Flavobacterium cerinum]|uniref:Acetylglutamate kinase n=1 Tax=Flavobacterium cerinum TaxID=2502784 RepID=A0A3S3U500_9FLAO|nr:acetylglutamate kinase [Flavobacterium cerinum]RWX03408.1 acetylglutamate kinase [Flavobacterium cerinum]